MSNCTEECASSESRRLMYMLKEARKEIKQLKEALKKCDSYELVEEEFCQKCEQPSGVLECKFCGEFEHTKDCQYIKLIGGEGE